MANNQLEKEQSEEKLLSGYVPADVYWDFKKAAADRKENLKEALMNAALLYIDAVPNKEVDNIGGQKQHL